MFSKEREIVDELDLSKDVKEYLLAGLKVHGHFCGGMATGFFSALEGMEKLGKTQEKNMDLLAVVYAGKFHAAGCFVDGVQFATGATFGKGLMSKEAKGKFQYLLIDKANKKAVKVKMLNEVMENAFKSDFITKYRMKGVKPGDVPFEVSKAIFKNTFSLYKNKKLCSVEGPFDYEVEEPKSTFNHARCEVCGDLIMENYFRVEDGKKVCLDCFRFYPQIEK
jgi:formylmethanofuran dehydrogenase subunit E